ncbi:MAG: hypothetical protein IIW92_00540 [Lachnospiraceae bacterium]|nr:hypothetical protein [Lachnospiraceae bacterium]
MSAILEFIAELIFDGAIELAKNKKVSKWIRYPMIAIISVFYLTILGIILFYGYKLIKHNIIGGLTILGIASFILILAIYALRKEAKETTEQEEDLTSDYKDQKGISPQLK